MNAVNFLPPAFLQKQARRRRVVRQSLLVAGMVGVLVAWGVVQMSQTHRLNQYVTTLEDEVGAAQRQKSEITKLRAEHALLIHQVKVQRELAQPVNHTQIIALMADVIDPTLGVTELMMTTHRPKPQAQSEASRKVDKKKKNPRVELDWIEIEFEGIAPNDIAIANVVATLSENPMFNGVQMHYTRQVERDGVIGRRFRLSTRVRLNRDFVPTIKGVADAH